MEDQVTSIPDPKDLFGALDLGTNSCRLLIAEKREGSYEVVDSYARVVRLGDELASHKHISEEASARAISALTTCAEKIAYYQIPKNQLRCVATAACRQAANGVDFVNLVKERTGIEFEIVTAEEEARLAIIGCSDLLESHTRYAVAFDVGGGSSEVMWMEIIPGKSPEIIDWISFPFGVVTVASALRDEPDEYAFLMRVRDAIFDMVKSFADRCQIHPHLRRNNVQMIGTSGTVTTLAALLKNLDRYDRTQVNGLKLSRDDIKKTTSRLYRMSVEERLLHPCIGPGRAELVMGGVSIFDGIYDAIPIDPVIVADRGVREGILVDLMSKSV